MLYPVIAGPTEIYGVTTAAAYLEVQAKYCDALRRKSGLDTPRPFEGPRETPARVNGGRWCATCVCGTTISVSVGWRLGCCVECGAIHRDVVVPADAAAIAAALMARPARHLRKWAPGTTVEQLLDANVAMGVA